MKNRSFIIMATTLLFTALTLNSCSTTPTKIEMTETAKQNLKTVDAYIFVKQDEIHADIDPSDVAVYTGGGLIPALIGSAIDNSRVKKSEELVQPIRNKLIDYDYAQLIKDEISNELEALSWVKIGTVKLFTGIPEKDLTVNISDSDANAILVVGSDCFFSPDFKSLSIKGQVQLLPLSNKCDIDFNNCIYKSSIAQSDNLELNLSKKEEAAAKWAENDAQLTKESIGKIAKAFAKQIVAGLNI